MADRVVVIGDPASVFVQTPVRFWRERGVDAVILTARWTGGRHRGRRPPGRHRRIAGAAVDGVGRAGGVLAPRRRQCEHPRRGPGPCPRTALQAWAHTAVPPSIAPPAHDALLIAAAADALDPVCVFAHEAFAYGLAASACTAPRRALMAWGADVLQYARMTDITHALVRQALHGVHYVLTNATTMEDALHERFDLPRARMARISYGWSTVRCSSAPRAPARPPSVTPTGSPAARVSS